MHSICVVCKKTSHTKCSSCHTSYCSQKCQFIDWKANGHSKTCKLIAARDKKKRRIQTRKTAKELCADELDPITLERFSEFDQKELIVINGKCFHLPSLYDWIINNDNTRNPLTNLDFTEQQLGEIQYAAFDRFSLDIPMVYLNGRSDVKTTNELLSFKKFFVLIMSNFPQGSTEQSFYSNFNVYMQSSIRFAIKTVDNGSIDVLDVIMSDLNHRLQNVGIEKVYVIRNLPPSAVIAKYQKALDVYRMLDKPIPIRITERVNMARDVVAEADRLMLERQERQRQVDDYNAETRRQFEINIPDQNRLTVFLAEISSGLIAEVVIDKTLPFESLNDRTMVLFGRNIQRIVYAGVFYDAQNSPEDLDMQENVRINFL